MFAVLIIIVERGVYMRSTVQWKSKPEQRVGRRCVCMECIINNYY